MNQAEAFRTAIESAQNYAEYVCIWRKDDGSYDYVMGDSKWSCEVSADEPKFTWRLLESHELLDENEQSELEQKHEVNTGGITLEMIYDLLGKDEAVNRELDALQAHAKWDDFAAATDA